MISKWKKKIWISGVVVIGIILFVSFFSIQLKIDVGLIILSIAILIIAFTIYSWFQYASRPKKQIHITNKVSLTSPPKILSQFITYKLRLSSEYEVEEKGEIRKVNLDEVNLSFNKSDHPMVYEYCMGIVNTYIQKNIELVRSKHPDAKVLDSEVVFPEEMLSLQEDV